MQRLHSISGASDEQYTSTSTANVQTLTIPKGALALLVSVETTSARLTTDGSAPASTKGHVIQTAQNPLYLPFAAGATLKYASTAGTSSILNVTWLF